MNKQLFLFLCLCISLAACRKEDALLDQIEDSTTALSPDDHLPARRVSGGFPENFEQGTKTAYTTANVSFGSGIWTLNDALIGKSTWDSKNGLQAIRMRNAGKLSMTFDVYSGITAVEITHAKYSNDATSYWSLWASQDAGATWQQIGAPVFSSVPTLQVASFAVNLSGQVRLEIRKTQSSGRINIDDVVIHEVDPVTISTPTRDNNLEMGNPSGATTNINNPNNYLLVKSQYAMSYNSSRGGANWVSWHLSAAWKGSAVRSNNYVIDNNLPSTFYRPSSSTYTYSGFDRGHQCPSDDRDGSQPDNDATFTMSNMLPQAPNANRVTWENLESYCRSLLDQGFECYVVAGGYGQGGTGSNGGVSLTIDNGRIAVPARLWKVIVVLPVGDNDLSRINAATRVIAVDMPNSQNVNVADWDAYRTSVDAIETATGYNILSNLSTTIQSTLEANIDNTPIL